ncbi:MAG: AzlC family ABC transporter permease [Spirochaetales bacterium]|nr:AzlC family ABC transporter permease [Spirochaetales bacterium]
MANNKRKDALEGIKDGFPIFLGYFTTALAFGLLTRTSGLRFVEGILISLTNYSGSGQFLMMNLFNAGSFLLEIVISVFFLNTRYIFMASSLYTHLENPKSIAGRLMCGFGTTDEIFAVAALKGKKLTYSYMAGIVFTSYAGWTSGTAMGYIAGTFLPDVIQKAAVITVYAMFASLLGSESRKNSKALLVLLVSAGLNSMLILLFGVGTGVSFLISMLAATIFGCFIYTDEEAGV